MDNIKVIYKISKNYWVELSQIDFSIIQFHRIDDENELMNLNNKIIKGNLINAIINLKCEDTQNYHLIFDDKSLFINNVKNKLFYNPSRTKFYIENICNSFRLVNKERLINRVFVNYNCTIDETLKEINTYVFCNHYSLWLYNDLTNYFTYLTSSFKVSNKFKKKDEFSDQISLFQEKNGYICEKFDVGKTKNQELQKIRTTNRIKIELSITDNHSSNFLIANFFSELDDYELRDESVALIKEILGLKFSKDYYPKVVSLNKTISDLTETFKVGNFQSYLASCVKLITKELDWEAASIFITDSDGRLKLSALDHCGDNSIIGIKPYDINDDSITSQIFRNNKLECVYDINSHPKNSHQFDEKTKHSPENWIGLPISATNIIKPIGVLRVKNKLDRDRNLVISFNKIDISILTDLAENIAYQYNIEQKFIEEEQNKIKEILKQKEENKELTEFLRTYRHEIKTPLTLITTASTRIKYRLCDEFLLSENNIPKKINEVLIDLEVVGSRLMYVVNSLSFDAQDLVKEITKCSLFKDVVIPIASFSKLYAEKKGKRVVINIDSLNISPIECDKNSSQMAFHVIVDNAIKYSKPDSVITIFGKEERDFCKVIVENYSIVTIQDNEKDLIYRKYYRTEEVESKKFEGSGIGLYLAREIMNINSGKILLTNLNNPTRFELLFKKI
ncbi:MAG: HAMP domain-containing sensor histidine kinase [Bacteroidales bacterium]|jgi:signal transduction histidine kinase|nr:HAMP domain-containing sensor histidine kinase [Bacteroidales bacterium]